MPMLTEVRDIVSTSDSSTVFTALTPPMDSTRLADVRVRVWLMANDDVEVRPAIRFSNDGITWDAHKELQTTFKSNSGWNQYTSWSDIFNLTSTTPRLFCQFGVEAQNKTASNTNLESAQCRLRIETRPISGNTVSAGPSRVTSKASDQNALFWPLTGAIPSDSFDEYRGTIEMQSTSGVVKIQLAYQTSNFPDDDTTWDTATGVGAEVSSNSLSYGTTFTSLTPNKQYVRWGLLVTNTTGGGLVQACIGLLRVDLRFNP